MNPLDKLYTFSRLGLLVGGIIIVLLVFIFKPGKKGW